MISHCFKHQAVKKSRHHPTHNQRTLPFGHSNSKTVKTSFLPNISGHFNLVFVEQQLVGFVTFVGLSSR
jgi:hypothetical protein